MFKQSTSSEFKPKPNDYDERLHVIEWHHMNLWKYFPYTMACSLSVRAVVYPLVLMKTRFQLQSQNQVYGSMMDAISRILRQEGGRAFWKGFLMQTPQVALNFMSNPVYEFVREILHNQVGISSTGTVSALA
uniref:Uncharacterized protein n=1 Tax=Acrobeloides nanus TaxID=290746 RepID=A0A914D6T0_9BILA